MDRGFSKFGWRCIDSAKVGRGRDAKDAKDAKPSAIRLSSCQQVEKSTIGSMIMHVQ